MALYLEIGRPWSPRMVRRGSGVRVPASASPEFCTIKRFSAAAVLSALSLRINGRCQRSADRGEQLCAGVWLADKRGALGQLAGPRDVAGGVDDP